VRRPVAGAHTIAEIAHHTATWNEVVRRRLDGESPQVADAENWPTTDPADDAAWDAVTARLFASGKALVRRIRTFPPERLDERRPGLEGTWFEMIAGVLQHVLYHAGQAALLRKGAGNG